ncbi:MAG: DUF4065 domain-containing protein [Peptostreptococcaceae bacterium]|nr:DUF4065 domain-containing protein [Peptostreptococcaceae bacterium]
MMTFCEECHEMVAYSTKNVTMEKEIKGKKIEFEAKEAFCPTCKGSLFVASVRDYNLKQMDTAFRTAENLINVDEIQQILDNYNIGKRPLSVLLGWGEVTITRYLDGAIPTKQYSEKLFDILNNPENMDSILESNKHLIADAAYRKGKEALARIKSSELLELSSENKIDSITKYMLINLVEITPLALQKLLYYAQGFNKVFNGTFLFQDDCQAWAHGPVYSEIYHKYKDFGYNPIDLAVSYDESAFNILNSEKEVLDTVIRNFGCYSGKILERMTHSEHPWLVTRNGLSDDSPSNEVIEKELISNYFEQIKQKYNMLSTSDASDYSKDLFEKLFN